MNSIPPTIEKIICAAIWYKEFDRAYHRPINTPGGIVLCGHRHPHIISQINAITGKRHCEQGKYIDGFLTNKNRFVDRVEGAKIALESKQIEKLNYGSILYSEDLY